MVKLSKRKPSQGNKLVTKQELMDQLRPINQKLDRHDQHFVIVDKRLARVEGRLTSLEEGQTEIRKDLKEMDGKIDRGFGKLDGFIKRFDDQRQENAAQGSRNHRVDTCLADHGRRIQKLEANVFVN